MVDPIDIASIVIGSVFGAIGTGLGIYNFVKALMKKPIPLFILPTITNTTPPKTQKRIYYTLRIDFELRNNGDKVSRLYYNSIMQLFDKDNNPIGEDIRPLINDKEIGIEKPDLPPHSINPKGYSHYFKIATENHSYGLLYFIGYYFNHRNRKKIHLQKFKFAKAGKIFKVDEIKFKKEEKEAELEKLPI
ncbi:MAG: hypothetical protein HZR80_10045 [Candidatus Heimdallarchaeota archaeon]